MRFLDRLEGFAASKDQVESLPVTTKQVQQQTMLAR
jgi:hypothetical protein